ncbi:DNA/RNA helicase domain-containing protein [Kribbella swartbergensis]
MTLFRQSGAGFVKLTLEDAFARRIAEQMLYHTGRRAAPAELRSWERSLPILAHDLEQAGLNNVEVLVEHHLPLTSKRADVVLAGRNPRTGGPSYVVVELKQWSRATAWEDDRELVLIDGYPNAPRLHPVAQVRGYCDYLADFSKFLEGQTDALAGAAYLHNAVSEAEVRDLYDYPQDARGRLFTGARRGEFIEFLQDRLDPRAPGAPYADQLITSAVAPSKQLLAVAAEEVQRREQFVLLAEQKFAHSMVLHEVERARSADRKSVVIVTGGPGSGKSVIALSLLGELARRGRSVLHATGSRSFTQTLRKVAGARQNRVQRMFKYFNQFMDAEPNELDVLILDEAHRIRETSVDRYTRAEFRTGRRQVDELIAAARVPVFLLDENQVVKPGELGTVAEIKSYAADLGLPVHLIELDAQFRCGGSEEYVQWVVRVLGLAEGGPIPWPGDPAFQVQVADTPEAMEATLRNKAAEGYGARIAAGYCWPWSDPRPDKTLVPDVQIGSWARPWNLKGDRRVGDAPPAALWATDPNGFGQVGCVYTAQGFEYDWSGVILGPDFVWRNGHFRTVRDANKDPAFRNRKITDDATFDSLVRNTYKVLLTRGMVGTIIYSPDPETRDALHQLVNGDAVSTSRQ